MKIRNHLFTSGTLMLVALATTAALMASILGASPASAGIICASPDLPPGCGEYLTPADVHALFEDPNLDPNIKKAILSDISHSRFLNPVITPVPDPMDGPDELEKFESTLTGLVEVTFGDGTVISDLPVILQGAVEVLSQGKAGNTTGTFQTEILSMSLSGDLNGTPIQIRESPDLASLGETTITPLVTGDFQIDSFFDVFVDISIDGGPFIPQTGGPSRVDLAPEPSAVTLLLLGAAIGFGSWRKRRRAANVV